MPRIPSKFAMKSMPQVATRAFAQFRLRDAVRLLMSYANLAQPAATFRLRGGEEVAASDAEDIATIVVVMLRRDYGSIASGSVVVDIGANIGVFTVWAALCGARRIIAVEPEPENMIRLEHTCSKVVGRSRVDLKCLAVAGASGNRHLAIRTSQTHSLNEDAGADPTIEVPCISLHDLLCTVDHVDLLKMDIEGGEYEAFYAADADTLDRIDEIRMEFHNIGSERKNADALVEYLSRFGFRVARRTDISKNSGMLWLDRRQLVQSV